MKRDECCRPCPPKPPAGRNRPSALTVIVYFFLFLLLADLIGSCAK